MNELCLSFLLTKKEKEHELIQVNKAMQNIQRERDDRRGEREREEFVVPIDVRINDENEKEAKETRKEEKRGEKEQNKGILLYISGKSVR